MPDWGTRGLIDYRKTVQPVFDKHCVSCHSGVKLAGELNLSSDETFLFNMSYLEIIEKNLVHFVSGRGRTFQELNFDYDEEAPLNKGSLLSRLSQHLDGHRACKVRLTFEEKLRVYSWIDANIPYFSNNSETTVRKLSPAARTEIRGVYNRRCASCHDQPNRPDHVDFLDPGSIHVHVAPFPGQWGIAESGMRARHFNFTNPKQSSALLAPRAKSAGGRQRCQRLDARGKPVKSSEPIFKSTDDPDYQKILRHLSK